MRCPLTFEGLGLLQEAGPQVSCAASSVIAEGSGQRGQDGVEMGCSFEARLRPWTWFPWPVGRTSEQIGRAHV